MACSGYFPRPVDREVLELLEARRPGALLGVRRSGVSTTARRLANIAGVPHKNGVKCGEYAVVEVAVEEVKDAVRCGLFAAATGTLEEVLKAADGGVILMPPMSTSELVEFLASSGVSIDLEAADLLLYKTGGYPEDVCKALEAMNYPARVTRQMVEELDARPVWFLEAASRLGRGFLVASILATASEEELKALSGEAGFWMRREGRLYVLKAPWLQFYAVQYDPELAKSVLEEALKMVEDRRRAAYYMALLWRLGVRSHVERSMEYVDVLDAAPPQLALDLSLYFLETAPLAGRRDVEAKALNTLADLMPILTYSVRDVEYLARRATALVPQREAYLALYNMGMHLLTAGKFSEAEVVLSTLEDLLFKTQREEEWLMAKRVLNLLQAYKEGLLGRWRETRRLLEEEYVALKFTDLLGDRVRRNLGWAYVMLGDFRQAKLYLKGDRGYYGLALLLLTTKKLGRLRSLAKAAKEPVIAALAGASLGLDVRAEMEELNIRPELKEALKALADPDPAAALRRLAAVLSRADPGDKSALYLYAVEAYLQKAASRADAEEVKKFFERLRGLVAEDTPGAAKFLKPSKRALAKAAVFFL